MAFYTRFRPARPEGLTSDKPSLVQPQFKESTDIGSMIRRALTGDRSVFRSPRFLNSLGAPEDFLDAHNKIAIAKSTWNDLPDKIKVTYGSPENLLRDFEKSVAEHSARLSHPLKGTAATDAAACADPDLTPTSTGDTNTTVNPAME